MYECVCFLVLLINCCTFTIVQLAKDEDRNYSAELLYQMYNDPVNKLYLAFLQPIVTEINRVNKLFQLEKASAVKLMDDLMTMYQALLDRVMKPRTFPTLSALLEYEVII